MSLKKFNILRYGKILIKEVSIFLEMCRAKGLFKETHSPGFWRAFHQYIMDSQHPILSHVRGTWASWPYRYLCALRYQGRERNAHKPSRAVVAAAAQRVLPVEVVATTAPAADVTTPSVPSAAPCSDPLETVVEMRVQMHSLGKAYTPLARKCLHAYARGGCTALDLLQIVCLE